MSLYKKLGMALCLATLAPLGGCRKGSPPVIQFLADQDAVVGQTLTVNVIAIDPEGDPLSFRFEAPNVPDINSTTAMSVGPDGQGIFTFTPVASQLGSHFFEFFASDGKNEGSLTIAIDVKGAVGSGSVPIFRKPLGTGTVLDLDASDSISLDIEIEDPDSAKVKLEQAPPLIDGANLSADDNGLAGTWTWKPSRDEIEGSDRWDLTLSADDGDNPPTIKDFIIVIRKRSGADCPGDPPQIDHQPKDFSTLQDLTITAQISDDKGLGSEPYVLYSLEDPGDPVDFTKMILVEMKLDDGDMRDGTWHALVPNPVANEGTGATADLYYLISAGDDDDPNGDCDHITDAPSSGSYKVQVTNAADSAGGPCDPCSADVQCGGDGDLCVLDADAPFCGKLCTGAEGECPNGYVCSPDDVNSVDGAAAQQCIPNSGTCDGGGHTGNCTDDDDEPNDDPGSAAGPLSTGNHGNRMLCQGSEDWYAITVDASAKVTATLSGDSPPDMDLALTTEAGVLITNSIGLTSDEELTSTSCLDAGTYALRVYTLSSSGSGSYSVGYSLDTASCNGGGGPGEGDCCVDNNSPGCQDEAVQTCVCGMDPFCCDTQWDNSCAMTAASDCGASCGSGGTGGGGGNDCCTTATTPGCSDSTIQSCVCASDSFCCDSAWDSVCVGQVGSLLCGPSCSPDDSDGYCCEAKTTTGCEINSIETCVCMADNFCCTVSWDQMCVDAISSESCSSSSCPVSA